MKTVAALLALILLALPEPAFADCNNLRIESISPATMDLSANASPSLTVVVRRAGPQGCSFYLACSNNGSSDAGSYTDRSLAQGAYTLPVRLCLDAACAVQCKTRNEASSSEVAAGSFPDGTNSPSTQTLTIFPRAGALEYPRFGLFSGAFDVRLYNGAFNSATLERSETFTLTYNMQKAIDLSIVDTGAPFSASSTSKTLDFGTLATGVQRTADLILKFNAGYRILLSTAHAGKLLRVGGTQTIDYSVTIDGAAVALPSTPTQVASGSGVSPEGGKRMPVVVTVGTVGPSHAPGNYQDSVMITVQATE